MKTSKRGRLIQLCIGVLTFGALTPLMSLVGPPIDGASLALTIALAEVLGGMIAVWGVLLWQGHLDSHEETR